MSYRTMTVRIEPCAVARARARRSGPCGITTCVSVDSTRLATACARGVPFKPPPTHAATIRARSAAARFCARACAGRPHPCVSCSRVGLVRLRRSLSTCCARWSPTSRAADLEDTTTSGVAGARAPDDSNSRCAQSVTAFGPRLLARRESHYSGSTHAGIRAVMP